MCTSVHQKKIFTVPNELSLGRIVLSPALGYLVLSENYKLALAFFILAGVSDMVRHYALWQELQESKPIQLTLASGGWLHCTKHYVYSTALHVIITKLNHRQPVHPISLCSFVQSNI